MRSSIELTLEICSVESGYGKARGARHWRDESHGPRCWRAAASIRRIQASDGCTRPIEAGVVRFAGRRSRGNQFRQLRFNASSFEGCERRVLHVPTAHGRTRRRAHGQLLPRRERIPRRDAHRLPLYNARRAGQRGVRARAQALPQRAGTRSQRRPVHDPAPHVLPRESGHDYSDSIKETGEYRTSAGDGGWTSVAISDVAAVAVAAIAKPGVHAGKTYNLREEAVTHQQAAEKISRVIGKKVTMVNLTPEEHYELVMKSSSRAVADHVVRSDKEKRDGQFSVVTPDLEMVLGRPGVSLDAFLQEQADAFKPEH